MKNLLALAGLHLFPYLLFMNADFKPLLKLVARKFRPLFDVLNYLTFLGKFLKAADSVSLKS